MVSYEKMRLPRLLLGCDMLYALTVNLDRRKLNCVGY